MENHFIKTDIFDPFKKPVDVELAKKHKLASIVHGRPLSDENCSCCGKFCDVKQFNIFTKTRKLCYMGIAYYFFFQ